MSTDLQSYDLGPLREQMLAAASTFAGAEHLSELLATMVSDVERMMREPVEVFPVCHHSPGSAVHMVQRLVRRPPRVIFMEMCEDMRASLADLKECRLPLALQAFAGHTDSFPASWTPLSVVAPLTEFSAEFQAIAFALENPGTELVFVDRSVDHIFQWMPQEEDALEAELAKSTVGEDDDADDDEASEEAGVHGAALGVEVGSMMPTFDAFRTFLLRNAQVRHFSEWWDQYVEQAVIGADYATYRQVLGLVGSLLRRLGRRTEDVESDRLRERYMWTRMKDYMQEHKIAADEAIYICGAIHAVSDVEEFGFASPARWPIPEPTPTAWLYGLIPSSYAAIEAQFGHPRGTISLAEATWKKAIKGLGLKPFKLEKKKKKSSTKKKASKKTASAPEIQPTLEEARAALEGFLMKPPALAGEDEEQLLRWCVDVVRLARKNGYLTSTADSIAIYQTSILLANLRNREMPTPYDFQDAAITCLEKDRVPKKRDIARVTEILLGGNRIGLVGYSSLPPLVQNVYDRLAPIGFNPRGRTIQRALMDFRKSPELRGVSDLLWKLQYLLGQHSRAVRPIMGERKLGHTPIQESWDIDIGKNQGAVIQLAYEGVTVEQVLEKRIKKRAFSSASSTLDLLTAVEDTLVFLDNPRLVEELGERSIELLTEETGGESTGEIFDRVRRLVHHHRSTPTGIPDWLKRFVATGYSHYATLLPESFEDRGTRPEQIANMLAFVFTLESLAIAMGCNRSQLLIAIRQSASVAENPDKQALLWSAEWLLGLREMETLQAFFDELIDNPLRLPALPDYCSGFLLALSFTPLVAGLVVELISKAFERLPDAILMPWMPSLIMSLKPHVGSVLPTLLKEARASYPAHLDELDDWTLPWERKRRKRSDPQAQPQTTASALELRPEEAAARAMLLAHRASTEGQARHLDQPLAWQETLSAPVPGASGPALSEEESAARALLLAHRTSTEGMAAHIEASGSWTEALNPSAVPATDTPASRLLATHPAALEALARHIL